MKVSLIITEQLSNQQLEHSYLLCLALLNFEHEVNVVFVDQAFKSILAEAEIQKQWLALKLFGVEAFYQLNLDDKSTNHAADAHCQLIDKVSFDALKSEMDLLL